MKPIVNNNYHDALITSVQIGPRREINLSVIVMSQENMQKGFSTSLRFSAIENFPEVAEYFQKIGPPSENRYFRIEELEVFDAAVRLEIDNHADVLIKHCKISEGEVDFK